MQLKNAITKIKQFLEEGNAVFECAIGCLVVNKMVVMLNCSVNLEVPSLYKNFLRMNAFDFNALLSLIDDFAWYGNAKFNFTWWATCSYFAIPRNWRISHRTGEFLKARFLKLCHRCAMQSITNWKGIFLKYKISY